MYKKTIILVFVIMVSLIVLMGVVEFSYLPVKASGLQQTTPNQFLGAIFYGDESILHVFDHELPLFNNSEGDEDQNTFTRHYNGQTAENGVPYSYDQHVGIDYSLYYEPVLAAADGNVNFAGWSDPANHRRLYGLHVQMNHEANTNYRVWYGHLSTLSIQTGDTILIDPLDPGHRSRILGISGNTGSLQGCDEPVGVDPNCSDHLHFEVRQIAGNRPVNPYGWIGLEQDPPIIDPWSIYVDAQGTPGAESHNLWQNPPSVTTGQYGAGGASVEAPSVNEYVIQVDDSDPEFFTAAGSCWSYRNDGMGINGGYQNASVEIVDNINDPPGTSCWAIWQFDPEIEAPAGDYDVYAHVPAYASTLHAYYTIHHNGETDEAVVVQAAYPNQEHVEWAYLGRYDFGLNDGISNATYEDKDYITVSNLTISDTASVDAVVVADAIRLLPANPPPNLEIPISQSSDDAGGPNPYNAGVCGYEVNKNALTMNEIYFGHCQNGTPTVSGFHFDNVQIPEDTTITAARLEFTVDTTPNNVIDVQFQGELVNDAATFSSSSLPHQRSPLTNAIVTWHLAEDGGWQVSEAQASPDLSSIIQEIIDQPGWQSGHAITIITQPTGNGTQARRVYGWERYGGNPLQTAKLQLWYDEPVTPTPTPVPTITPTASPTPSSSVPAPTGLTAVYISNSCYALR